MRVPVKIVRSPFYLLEEGALIPYPKDGFFLNSQYISSSNQILSNVGRNNRADLQWIIDHDGRFIELTSLGLVPKTFIQKLGLKRQRERFQIEEPRPITVGEFASRIATLKDPFPEAPVAAYVRRKLRRYPHDRVLDTELMIDLLGE